MQYSKIAIFGDSVMRGAIACRGKRMALRPDHDHPELRRLGYCVQNFAHIGSTIQKGLEEIRYRLPSLDRKTAVVLGFGGNDCDFDWRSVAAAPNREHFPNVKRSDYLRLYEEAIGLVRQTGAGVWICSLVPLDCEKYFAYISEGKDKNALLSWLGDAAMLYRWHEGYDRALIALAARLNVPVIDLRAAFLTDRAFHQTLIGYDGIHPTQEGYEIIDRVFSETFQAL